MGQIRQEMAHAQGELDQTRRPDFSDWTRAEWLTGAFKSLTAKARPTGMGDRSPGRRPCELLSATVAEIHIRPSFRAAAAVMRATADRFDAVLSDVSLSEAEAVDRLADEAEELCRAMETLEGELEELGE